MLARVVFTLLLPALTWLLLAAPDLSLSGNLAIFVILCFFEWNWLWQRAMFRAVRGDEFVYGHVSQVFSTFALLAALAIGIGLLAVHHFALPSWRQIHPWIILAWLLCLVGMWTLPLLSSSKTPRPYRSPHS